MAEKLKQSISLAKAKTELAQAALGEIKRRQEFGEATCCNEAKEPPRIPVTLQTSDDSVFTELALHKWSLDNDTPTALNNFLRICAISEKEIESVIVQVNFTTTAKEENA